MKLKWILTGIVGLLVAVVVAGYAILSTLDLEQYRGVIEAEAKKATGRDLALAGPIDLKSSLTPAITVDDVTLSNAAWGSQPEMVKLKRFELQAALMPLLSGNVQVKRLILVEPDILVETDAEGKGNWVLETAASTGEGTTEGGSDGGTSGTGGLNLAFDEINIVRGSLTYRDGKTGQEHRVLLDELTGGATGSDSPINLDITGSYNDLAFAVKGVFGSFDQFNSGPFPVQLTAEAAGATLGVEGSIAQPLAGQGADLKISAKGESLADLGAALGNALPPIGPYDVATRVSQEGETIKLSEMTAKVGASDIAGAATVSLAGPKPVLNGAFSSNLIDLADFTGGAPAGEAGGDASEGEASSGGTEGAASGGGRYVFTDDPLPLEGLQAADAEITLKAALLRLQEKMELADLDLTLSLQSGRLAVQPLTAGFSGGQIQAQVDLDGGQAAPPLAAVLKVDDLDYGKLLQDMGIDDTVAGTMDVDVDLKGAGAAMREIAGSLNGRSEIVSNEGVITNKLLKIVAVGLGDVMGPLLGGDEDARLNCMISRFDIKNGMATSQAMVVDTEQFTVSGGGTVNLRAEELNLNFDTATREASIASLAVPFNVTGTLASPSVAPDPLGTALGIAKTAGMVINPVAGIGVLIGDKVAGSTGGGDNPCVVAVNESAGGAAAEPSVIESVTEGAGGAVGGAAEGAADAVEGAVEGIKNLFGD